MDKRVAAKKALDRERGFAEGRRPTREALWTRIEDDVAESIRLFGSDRPHKPDPTRRKLAAQLFERFQALYLLLRRYDYDAFAFRRQFAVVESVLGPHLVETPRRYGDLAYFCDDQHARDVDAEAAHIVDAIEKESLQPITQATRTLSKKEVGEMLKAFTEVHYAKDRVVYLEDAFARQMLEDWDKPMLTTTAHAVETLHAIARRREYLLQGAHDNDTRKAELAPDFKVAPEVLEFVQSCYQDRHFRDPLDDQDLYATSSGIAVFKAHADLASNQLATADQLRALFQDTGIEYAAIREWATQRLRELLTARGTKIIELNHAVRILWNLSGDCGVRVLLEDFRPALRDFLKRCMRPVKARPRDYPASFAMSPDTDAICLTACLAALRVMKHAELADAELQTHLRACEHYVWGCHSPESGFGSSIGHTPDLLHTYMAVTTIQSLHLSGLTDAHVLGVVRFMSQCFKDGGYALLPEWQPSAYGTRLAVQILERLRLPLHRLSEMSEFIGRLLARDPGRGAGYRGYRD
jgi:hypothetical protein